MLRWALAIAVLLGAATAHGDELSWRAEWPKFRIGEHVATGAAAVAVGTLYLMPPATPTWGGGILFDDTVRAALRAETSGGVRAAELASSIAYGTLLVAPVALDLSVPLLRGSSEVSGQLVLIDLESLVMTGLVFRVVELATRRARPYVTDCIERTHDVEACRHHERVHTNGFMSGHAGIAATGAALICTNQLHVHAYGRVGSPIACGVGVALAVTAGVGRLVSDNHYATDVLAGWVVGVLSGWVLPSLLHYGFDGNGVGASRAALSSSPQPLVAFATAF